MRETKNSFSSKWIGIILVVSVLITILVKNIVYAVCFRASLTGKIDIAQHSRQTNTVYYTVFYLVNTVIVGLLFVYFLFNRNQDQSQKEHRIGFTASVISLSLQLVAIILYIVAEAQIYSLLIKPGILKAQLTFNITFFVSFIIVLTIYWKIIFSTKSMNSITKILSFSLLAFGLCVFLISMVQIKILSFYGFRGTGRYITRYFFDYIFRGFYNVFAVIAGTTIILVSKQKEDLI